MAVKRKLPKGLLFRNGEYKQRIRWKENGREQEKKISLDTDSYDAAEVRSDEVRSFRASIKNGKNPVYTWKKQNPNDSTFNDNYSLIQAKKDYLNNCKIERIGNATISLYCESIDKLINVVGKNKNIDLITYIHIQQIKELKHKYTGKLLAPETVNRHIRAIGTFFNWLKEYKNINSLPTCKQLTTLNKIPRYYSNNEFDLICEGFNEFYQNIYHFHRDTGLRLSEPYKSELVGNYLLIPPNSTKNIIERYYFLTDEQVEIIKVMREYIFGRLKDGIVKNMKNAIQPISRQWSDKVKKLDIPDDKRKFHCLRHTFCVRKYHQCRDLYEVQMLMGHSDIQQTQKYAKLWHNLTGKLEVEFPDITPRNITSGTPERDAMDKTQFNFNYLSRIMRM